MILGLRHVLIEVGDDSELPVAFLKDIKSGIELGLQELPARPTGLKGMIFSELNRVKALCSIPKLSSTAFLMDSIPRKQTKIHILMLGGGPEIRASTYRVFISQIVEKYLRKL